MNGPAGAAVDDAVSAGGHPARQRPTAVAHLAQLPEAGSFVTADAAGTPLLLVRQDDGSVRVLANVCRHRGARVEAEPAGRRKMFACPYHRWCYTRTGAIRSIPFDDGFAGTATLETAAPWARAGADAEPVAPGTFARWSDGYADLVSVRPAGPRLNRTVIGFWFLAAPGGEPGEEAGVREEDRVRGDERVARLRAAWP